MIKNSTVIIAASLILIGIITNGLIDNIFERKNLKDKIEAELHIKKLEVNEKILSIEPKILNSNGTEIVYLPDVSFQDGYLNADYALYRYENHTLIRIPTHN